MMLEIFSNLSDSRIPGFFLQHYAPGAEAEIFCSTDISLCGGIDTTSGGHGHLSQSTVFWKGFLTCLMVSKQTLEQVLRELRPLCIAEQLFIEKFFQLRQNSAELQVLEVSYVLTDPTNQSSLQVSARPSRHSGMALTLLKINIREQSCAPALQQQSVASGFSRSRSPEGQGELNLISGFRKIIA